MTSEPVKALVEGLAPADALEARHQAETLVWLASTKDVYRREKPATPDPHLVSYFVPVDRAQNKLLLVEHRLAGLWLPPGGHVEPNEHPAVTVQREAHEELGMETPQEEPVFLTRTRTVGAGSHVDVSLWFLLHGDADQELQWDRREFASIRWWSPAEIQATSSSRFDPHLARFLRKIEKYDQPGRQ